MSVEVSDTLRFREPARLHPPELPEIVVSRERLLRAVAGRRRVLLVCAPAGAGKTLLAADWTHRMTADGDSVAWLSLEERDDSPSAFWTALLHALHRATGRGDPDLLRPALGSPDRGSDPRFVAAVAEAISDSGVRGLVLDDVHRLRHREVLAGLDLLIDQLPRTVTVLLLARTPPALSFSSLLVRDSLREIDGTDLAFTVGEAQRLFDQLLEDLPAEAVTRLVARTEGWAVGLRLAAHALERSSDRQSCLDSFEGDRREVSDYLFAEVLSALPEDLLDFLLDTCAPRQLTISLAAHLSGRDDAGEVLETLHRSNMLVVRISTDREYRYHGLLRSAVLALLERRSLGALRRQHARAALWYDEHDDPSAAIEHADLAGDADLVSELIRHSGLRLILEGRAAAVHVLAERYSASQAADLSVAAVVALAAMERGDLDIADVWLRRLTSLDLPPEDPVGAALQAAAIVQRALLGGCVTAALERTGILELFPTGHAEVDLMMLTCRASSRVWTGSYREAVHDLESALRISNTRGYDAITLKNLSDLAGVHGAACDWVSAQQWAHRAVDFARSRGEVESPHLCYAYLLAAWTAFQTDDPETQREQAERGLRALTEVNPVEVEVGVRSMEALARFERSAGAERLRAARDFHRIWQGTREAEEVSPVLISQATPQEVRLCLLTGNHTWAEEAVERLRAQLPGSAEAALVHAQVCASRGHVREALAVLGPALKGDLPSHAPTTAVTAGVLAACLEHRLGHRQRAFDALRGALSWGAPNAFRRPFLDAWEDLLPLLEAHRGRFAEAEDFVQQLLGRRRGGAASIGTVVDHGLTERESSVLRDLPAMLTLAEIGTARGVSENTVKTHVRGIYRKLGASNRAEAVRLARERGLL